LSSCNDIKEELDDMESRGIITKINEGEPTAWVNSLVYCRKPSGKLKICLDPKDLNKAISREHHVIPTLEEILPKLSGAKYFSIVDAKCGYWNVVLDQESSYITTFNLPFGRYRFLLVPFGPTPAFSVMCIGDIFQPSFNHLSTCHLLTCHLLACYERLLNCETGSFSGY